MSVAFAGFGLRGRAGVPFSEAVEAVGLIDGLECVTFKSRPVFEEA